MVKLVSDSMDDVKLPCWCFLRRSANTFGSQGFLGSGQPEAREQTRSNPDTRTWQANLFGENYSKQKILTKIAKSNHSMENHVT